MKSPVYLPANRFQDGFALILVRTHELADVVHSG